MYYTKNTLSIVNGIKIIYISVAATLARTPRLAATEIATVIRINNKCNVRGLIIEVNMDKYHAKRCILIEGR